MMGVMYNENSWLQRAKEMEQKVAEAENKSKEVNVVVEEKIVEKTKIVKEKGRDIIQYIDRWNTKEIIKEVEGPERVRREEVIKYIENCPVPKEIVDIHNQAAGLDKK
jgi:phosphoribosylanthranilate isomerase